MQPITDLIPIDHLYETKHINDLLTTPDKYRIEAMAELGVRSGEILAVLIIEI